MSELLGRVAYEYQRAVAEGRPPTMAVAGVLGTSRTTAGRRIAEARREGLLPAGQVGRVGGHATIHRATEAVLRGLRDAGPRWTVCRACLDKWPCEDAVE